MPLASSQSAAAGQHPARFPARFTVEQFHRLCEAVPEQRLELIDGEVLQVIAKGTRHTAVVHRLITVIQAVLTSEHDPALQLRVESPLDLGPANEPEPDLALVVDREDNYWEAHPTAADTALVIEVQTPCLHRVREVPGKADALLLELRASVERLIARLPRS